MAIMQISVVPIGTQTPSLSRRLAQLPHLCEQSGLSYRVLPMGTAVEGTVPKLLALAAQLHEAGFGADGQRVLTHITLDDRRDVERAMDAKVDSLLRAADELGP